jgi:SAM-dependent methyltransferase
VTSGTNIVWSEANQQHSARWRAENGAPPPKRVIIADDTITADVAYRLACEGTAMLWRGDFQNAKQLLQAMARRADAKPKRALKKPDQLPVDAFNLHRLAQSQRARTLSMLLIPFDADYTIPLRRAPGARLACSEAWGAPAGDSSVASLRELLGIIGAHEWRRKGVAVPALNEKIHPHYGVFAPIRGEYVGLVAEAEFSNLAPVLAFDIGTGTGVLAAVLAQRGIKKIIATDQDPRALACARENLVRLKLNDRVEIIEADLFPEGRAPLIVCNPPWLPARPSSPIERAIYDPESSMLRGFLNGLAAHLEPNGEGWLIISDLAEHLGLRSREALLGWIDDAGLSAAGRLDVRPTHPRVSDADDVLHVARAKEITSLWKLRTK